MTHRELDIPAEEWLPPWPLLWEIANHCPPTTWSVAGGTMVQIHAELAGTAPSRTTDDVDLLLDVLTRKASIVGVVAQLARLGFTPEEPDRKDAPFHRMRRGQDVIDLLVADHLPSHVHPRFLRHPVMPIDGGAQALGRIMNVDLVHAGASVTVTVPDLLGALVLKAAAAVADSRDNARHERDAALLAALITDHASELARMHGSDRHRLGALATRLADPYNPAWLVLPDDLVVRGRDTLRILTGIQV